jgi:hypothetical protein
VAFVIGSIVIVLFLVGVLAIVGRFYGTSDADLVDWYPTRSPELEVQNEIDDVRNHGKDERVPVKSFYDGQEYLYRLVKLLASAK